MQKVKKINRPPKYSFGVAKQLIFDCYMELIYHAENMTDEQIGNKLYDVLSEIDLMKLEQKKL